MSVRSYYYSLVKEHITRGIDHFKRGDIDEVELGKYMEFCSKYYYARNLNITRDQLNADFNRYYGYVTTHRDLDIGDVENGLEALDRMISNADWESWPVLSSNFKHDNFLKCGCNIAPQWMLKDGKPMGLYLFTTESGKRIPVLYDDKNSVVIMADSAGGAMCALPDPGYKYLQFINRHTETIVSIELVKVLEEIEDPTNYYKVFSLVHEDPSIYDPTVCYYKSRTPKFIRISCSYMQN